MSNLTAILVVLLAGRFAHLVPQLASATDAQPATLFDVEHDISMLVSEDDFA